MSRLYCWRCPACGDRFNTTDREPAPYCTECLGPDLEGPRNIAMRDYRAEAVGIGAGVAESKREYTTSGYRDLFLPSAKDFQGPKDPDGQKGLRDWAEKHGPRDSNKRPAYPAMTKRTF